MGDVVCTAELRGAFGGSIDGSDSANCEAPAAILVSGQAPVLPEELRSDLHSAGGCGQHHRVGALAASTMGAAQTRHGSAAHAERPDSQQRVLHGIRRSGCRKSGDERIAAGLMRMKITVV